MSAPYASTTDVTNTLGTIGNRLPAWVDVASFLATGHAGIVDQLSRVYPDGLPTFAGDGLEVVRYAEAQLAAAMILEAIRVNLPDLGDAPDRLRESSRAALSDGVVGYPPGSTPSGGSDPGQTSTPGPRVSSFTPLSAFPDPYASARDDLARYQ